VPLTLRPSMRRSTTVIKRRLPEAATIAARRRILHLHALPVHGRAPPIRRRIWGDGSSSMCSTHGGEVLASYDRYMMYHRRRTGRPDWAERSERSNQRIALARLLARVTDRSSPREILGIMSPQPPPSSMKGRDGSEPPCPIAIQRKKKFPAWWIFAGPRLRCGGRPEPHGNGRSRPTNLPSTERCLQAYHDANGKRVAALEAYPEWSARTSDVRRIRADRIIWMHIRGDMSSRAGGRVFAWLSQQDLQEHWMVEGAEFPQGFEGSTWGIYSTLPASELYEGGGASCLRRCRRCVNSFLSYETPPEAAVHPCPAKALFAEGDSGGMGGADMWM